MHKLWAGLLVFLVFATADAACINTREIKKGSGYTFSLALIDSFGYAKSGLERFSSEVPSRDTNFVSSAGQLMYEVKLAAKDYECAASIVASYKSSKNEAIQTAAEAAYRVYTSIVALDQQLINEYKKVLDGKVRDAETSAFVERIADLAARKDEVWKTLPIASVSAAHALVALPKTKGGKLEQWNIIAAQRNVLKIEIRKTLGEMVTAGAKAGQSSVEACGALLYEFLSNTEWKRRSE